MTAITPITVAITAFLIGQQRDTIDRLFADWHVTSFVLKTLNVEFDYATTDPIHGQPRLPSKGHLRVLKTNDGHVYASLDMTSKFHEAMNLPGYRGLKNQNDFYLLDPKSRHAVRFRPADGDGLRFVSEHVMPFFVALDPERAAKQLKIAVIKEDKFYRYLSLRTDATRHDGVLVVMKEDHPTIPKGMPRVIQFTSAHRVQTRIDITSWRMNSDGWTPNEFARPADRPNWTVSNWN